MWTNLRKQLVGKLLSGKSSPFTLHNNTTIRTQLSFFSRVEMRVSGQSLTTREAGSTVIGERSRRWSAKFKQWSIRGEGSDSGTVNNNAEEI